MRRRGCGTGCLGALLLGRVPGLFSFIVWNRETSLTAAAPAEALRIHNGRTRKDQGRRTTGAPTGFGAVRTERHRPRRPVAEYSCFCQGAMATTITRMEDVPTECWHREPDVITAA